jgi:hypothetical protein
MGSMKPALEEPRPWADDERLQDPFQLGAMNLVIKLVQEFATLAEKLPEGSMLKTQSIPAAWEAVKDLKQESIKKLQVALKNMQDIFINKDNSTAVGSKRGKEEIIIEESDLKKGKEESEIDEIDSAATKARKTGSLFDNITRRQVLDEEGTCAISFSAHRMCRLITHAPSPLLRFKNIASVLPLGRFILHTPLPLLVLLSAHVPCLVVIQMGFCHAQLQLT